MGRSMSERGGKLGGGIQDTRGWRQCIEGLEERRLLSIVSGYAFVDANANGEWDTDDGGPLLGTIIYADLNNDGKRQSTEPKSTTDFAGSYSLTLDPGRYVLRAVFPSGYTSSAPAAGFQDVLLLPGMGVMHVDFGAYSTGSIFGVVYFDSNRNGTRDAIEINLGDRAVYVDLNTNGQFDDGEPKTQTSSSGGYRFDLAPGAYEIRVITPDGWTLTDPASGYRSYTVKSGIGAFGLDFGLYRGTKLTGLVYHDLNANGRRDIGEPGLPGWTVRVLLWDTTPEAVTDSDGLYTFEDLSTDGFMAELVSQSGWKGASSTSFGGSLTPRDLVYSWGVRNTSRFIGRVAADLHGDGSVTNDPALPLQTVYIDSNKNGVLDANEPTSVTNDLGYFCFAAEPGTYTIRPVLPRGYSLSSPSSGYLSAFVWGAIKDLSVGTFAFYGPHPESTLFGYVYNDKNANAKYDPDESALPGHMLYIDNDNDGTMDSNEPTGRTDSSGYYGFIGLTSGTYHVRQLLAPGWNQTAPADNKAWDFTFASTTNYVSVDFGSADLTGPQVLGASFASDNLPQAVRFTFSEDVGSSLFNDAVGIQRLETGETVRTELVYDASLAQASFTFPDFADGTLPSGHYRAALTASVIADAAGNAMANDYTYAFIWVDGTSEGNLVLPPGSDEPLVVNAVAVAPAGQLDLLEHDLVVQSGPGAGQQALDRIISLIRSARDGGSQPWTGAGITSSAARGRAMTTLAAVSNDRGGGLLVDPGFDGNAIVVKYTWDGDANLDGMVNADDYFLIDSGYITQKKGYYNGDFNYDGVINADDYFLIDSAYIGQEGILAAGRGQSVDVVAQQVFGVGGKGVGKEEDDWVAGVLG